MKYTHIQAMTLVSQNFTQLLQLDPQSKIKIDPYFCRHHFYQAILISPTFGTTCSLVGATPGEFCMYMNSQFPSMLDRINLLVNSKP